MSKRIRLTDVEVLTFQQGRKTSGRRSKPIQQMRCIGGGACRSKYEPETVQCRNMGADGSDVQWQCKGSHSGLVRLGKAEVLCEGYDYPEDPYIFKGSCGIEYSLHFTDGRASTPPETGLSWVIPLAMVALFLLFACCSRPPRSQAARPDPPPPYEPQDATFTQQTPKSSESSRPGFWSGFGLGGLTGYALGSRRNDNYYGRTGQSFPRQQSRSPTRSGPSSTTTSTTYASTRRR